MQIAVVVEGADAVDRWVLLKQVLRLAEITENIGRNDEILFEDDREITGRMAGEQFVQAEVVMLRDTRVRSAHRLVLNDAKSVQLAQLIRFPKVTVDVDADQ